MAHHITNYATDSFFLNNVRVEYISPAGTLTTLPDRNKGIVLKWDSNGDTYNVYSGANTKPDPANDTRYPIDNGLTTDTVFVVEALKEGKHLYQEYLVKVNTPDIALNSVTAKAVDFSALAINMVGTGKPFKQGTQVTETYNAPTDGFVVATIYPVTAADKALKDMITVATIKTTQDFFPTSCITSAYGQALNSVTIPVKKGENFSILAGTPDNKPGMTTTFYWMGLGAGSPILVTPSEEENKLIEDYKKGLAQKSNYHPKQQRAADLITALEDSFGKQLDDGVREQLLKKLL